MSLAFPELRKQRHLVVSGFEPSDRAAFRLSKRYDRSFRHNLWNPKKIFKLSPRVCDENAGRAAYYMYSAAMRAGDAPQCCELGPGTSGLGTHMVKAKARGGVRKKFPFWRKKWRWRNQNWEATRDLKPETDERSQSGLRRLGA
jgi:hypothetical protein